MKLLTVALKKKMPPLYSQENIEDPEIIVKFFDPTGYWQWYATEGSAKFLLEDGTVEYRALGDPNESGEYLDTIFFGLVRGFENELGNFSLKELSEVKLRFGLGIERDMYFGSKKLSEVR